MADLLGKSDFIKQHFHWYYSEGPAKREGYNDAAASAWTSYQNTGVLPWGGTAVTPTTTPTTATNIPTAETPPEGSVMPSVEFTTIPTPGKEPHVPTGPPIDEDGNLCSQSGKPPCGAGGGITPAAVTPAPPYEISPAQQAFEDMFGGKITDWAEAGGYGIPEETQAQMIQQQTDSLKASEAENLRVMRNNMERRGITNSGFVFANEQAIRSNTSKAIASGIADIQIKSALMKMASFETAMGQAGQFLGYLSEQSQLKYAPEFATWSAEQLAKMQAWQADIDFQKLAINQAYQQSNIKLTAQLQSQLAEKQHGYDLELAQMELEANRKAAKAEGAGNIFGIILGGIFSLLPGS